MNSTQKYVTLIFLFSISLGFSQAQKNETTTKEIPVSIYTATQISSNLNSLLNINKRLNLKSYHFLVLNEKNIEEGIFTFPLCTSKLNSSNYIYETYTKVYNKSVLESAFFKVSDLYRIRTKNSL